MTTVDIETPRTAKIMAELKDKSAADTVVALAHLCQELEAKEDVVGAVLQAAAEMDAEKTKKIKGLKAKLKARPDPGTDGEHNIGKLERALEAAETSVETYRELLDMVAKKDPAMKLTLTLVDIARDAGIMK
jgi:hypothetical protein